METNKFVDLLKQYSGWNALVSLSRRKSFPGHRDITWYEVISFLAREMQRDAITTRAASVTFSFFVSLFPTLLMLFTLIPYLPVSSFQTTLLSTMEEVMPANIYELVGETIEDIVLNQRAGLLSVSLILAVYYSSQGVMGLMRSFDKALPTFRTRTFWEKQGVAFKILGLLVLLVLVSTGLIIGGQFGIRWLTKNIYGLNIQVIFWVNILRWLTIIAIFYFSISLIYYYGPATHERWHFFSTGSTVATLLALLIALAFSWLINTFVQYNRLYGSIGTVLVTLLWIYYNSLSLLLGFELNASIEINKKKLVGLMDR